MNATIIHKVHVKDTMLDNLAEALPGIIADTLELPGGKLAMLKPEHVSLQFSQASLRDVGSDIKIMILAKNLTPRLSNEKDLANEILEKVVVFVTKPGEEYSIDVRLYLMEVGVAEHSCK